MGNLKKLQRFQIKMIGGVKMKLNEEYIYVSNI